MPDARILGHTRCNPCVINDLTLRVEDSHPEFPACYLGNQGLMGGNWSEAFYTTPDCDVYTSAYADTLNNVENVFVQLPEPGTWTVRVHAVDVVEDGDVEYEYDDPSYCIPNPTTCTQPSPSDVDFALVVSLDMDCNANNRSDADDILEPIDPFNPTQDCNHDGVPDECQAALDCNENQVIDECESIAVGACCVSGTCTVVAQTCCQDQAGTFKGAGAHCGDCNSNGVADVCAGFIDCNTNKVLDECDIASGCSTDCEPNGVPDECDPRGACCLTDGSCEDMTECACNLLGGFYSGNHNFCAEIFCPLFFMPGGGGGEE